MGDLDIGNIQNGDIKSSKIGNITHDKKIKLEKFYYSWRFGNHYKEFGD